MCTCDQSICVSLIYCIVAVGVLLKETDLEYVLPLPLNLNDKLPFTPLLVIPSSVHCTIYLTF